MKRKLRKAKVKAVPRGLILDKKAFKKISVKTITVLGKKVDIVDGGTFIRIGHTTRTLQGNSLFASFSKILQELFVKQMLIYIDLKDHDSTERYTKADCKAIEFIVNRNDIDKHLLFNSMVEVFLSANKNIGHETRITNYVRLREIAKKLKLINNDHVLDKLERFKRVISTKLSCSGAYDYQDFNNADIELDL